MVQQAGLASLLASRETNVPRPCSFTFAPAASAGVRGRIRGWRPQSPVEGIGGRLLLIIEEGGRIICSEVVMQNNAA